jgi:hypothetical protein
LAEDILAEGIGQRRAQLSRALVDQADLRIGDG